MRAPTQVLCGTLWKRRTGWCCDCLASSSEVVCGGFAPTQKDPQTGQEVCGARRQSGNTHDVSRQTRPMMMNTCMCCIKTNKYQRRKPHRNNRVNKEERKPSPWLLFVRGCTFVTMASAMIGSCMRHAGRCGGLTHVGVPVCALLHCFCRLARRPNCCGVLPHLRCI